MKVADWYKRWRHGHGFGVHSPFAYRMVREVLRPSSATGYYAYGELSSARRRLGCALSQKEVELIYRVLVALRPATVAVSEGPSQGVLQEIVRCALPHSAIVDGADAQMLLCEGAAQCSGNYAMAYFTDSSNSAVKRIWAETQSGHMYHNPHRALIVSRCLPRQSFAVKF